MVLPVKLPCLKGLLSVEAFCLDQRSVLRIGLKNNNKMVSKYECCEILNSKSPFGDTCFLKSCGYIEKNKESSLPTRNWLNP